MIVDTHLHVIDKGALAYPWLEREPALDRDFSYAAYASEAKRVGISRTIHMEVDVRADQIEAETDNVERLAAEPDSLIVAAIAACRPEEESFAGYLDCLSARPIVRGLRRVLHVMPDELSESRLFRDNIRRLAPARLAFDLCVLPRQMPQAIALMDAAPDVQFVLDHCGVPDIKGGQQQPWREQIAEIARRPNVAAKISGIVAYADPESWTVQDLRPYVEHTIGCFGWDRLVWGSDWPVCTLGGGLSTWVAATHALIRGASEEERRKLFSDNAERIWRLTPTQA